MSKLPLTITYMFWITEYLFYKIFKEAQTPFIEGILDLTIGLYLKYLFDKKFFFANNSRQVIV